MSLRISLARRTAVAATLSIALASVAQSQTINVAGYTTGIFCDPSAPVCDPGTAMQMAPATLGGTPPLLSFTGRSFSFAMQSGSTHFIGGTLASLGTFTLNTTDPTFIGRDFSVDPANFALRMVFTAPGNTSQLFSSLLVGSISNNGNGGLMVDFGPTAALVRTLAFANGTTGTFRLDSPEALTGTNGRVDLEGRITLVAPQAVVPEPATVALFGAGLLGLAGIAQRRRRA